MINVEARWLPVEIFNGYQVVSGQMQVRGRFQQMLNADDPYTTLRELSTAPLLPGAPRLQGIAEGQLSKVYFGAVRLVEPEPPPPDQALELTRRFIYFQGATFTVKGAVEFPVAADPKLHREMMFKARFFAVVDATLTVIGAEAPALQWPLAYVNRDLMVGLYLN